MSAYIMVETKKIWFWQLNRYINAGWNLAHDAPSWMHLRMKVERCIG